MGKQEEKNVTNEKPISLAGVILKKLLSAFRKGKPDEESLEGRFTARQIELTEQLRAAVIARQAKDEATQAEESSWSDALPPLPPEPKDSEKRVIIIKKRRNPKDNKA